MKNKKKILGLLLPLVFITGASAVASTYAYWNVLKYQEAHNIDLGQGVVLSVDVVASAPAEKTLVPTGKVINPATQVDKIELYYNVGLAHDASSVGTLEATVVASEIAIDANEILGATYANVDISPDNFILSTTDTEVVVTVTLDEPVDQTDYEAVAGKDITFKLTFTAALAD